MEAQAGAEPVTSEEAHFLLGRSVMHFVTYEAATGGETPPG